MVYFEPGHNAVLGYLRRTVDYYQFGLGFMTLSPEYLYEEWGLLTLTRAYLGRDRLEWWWR